MSYCSLDVVYADNNDFGEHNDKTISTSVSIVSEVAVVLIS